MTYIIILLGIIALVEIWRMVLNYMPINQKRYFKQRDEGVSKMIWDLSFKVFQTRELREGIRRLYDQAKNRYANLETQVQNWPQDKDEGDKKRAEDEMVRLKRDIERHEDQMKSLDAEIDGKQSSPEHPNGVTGINGQIDSLMELRKMIRDWRKGL